jgi:hypothetical protein
MQKRREDQHTNLITGSNRNQSFAPGAISARFAYKVFKPEHSLGQIGQHALSKWGLLLKIRSHGPALGATGYGCNFGLP